MSIQDIFAHDPAQHELDALANRHARIYIAALKAATNVVDEVNRAEPMGLEPAEPSEGAEPKPADPSAEASEEIEPEGELMGMDEIMHIADEIFKALVQQVILMNQVNALTGGPAAEPAPDVPAPADAARRPMRLRAPITPKTA